MRTDAIRLLPFLATLHANDLVPAVLNCENVGVIRVKSQSEVREHVNLQRYIHTDAIYHSGTHRVGSTVAPNLGRWVALAGIEVGAGVTGLARPHGPTGPRLVLVSLLRPTSYLVPLHSPSPVARPRMGSRAFARAEALHSHSDA